MNFYEAWQELRRGKTIQNKPRNFTPVYRSEIISEDGPKDVWRVEFVIQDSVEKYKMPWNQQGLSELMSFNWEVVE